MKKIMIQDADAGDDNDYDALGDRCCCCCKLQLVLHACKASKDSVDVADVAVARLQGLSGENYNCRGVVTPRIQTLDTMLCLICYVTLTYAWMI